MTILHTGDILCNLRSHRIKWKTIFHGCLNSTRICRIYPVITGWYRIPQNAVKT